MLFFKRLSLFIELYFNYFYYKNSHGVMLLVNFFIFIRFFLILQWGNLSVIRSFLSDSNYLKLNF